MSGAVLRVGGSKQAIRALLARTRMKPQRVYLQGEPTSPGSAQLARRSYILVSASSAEGDDFARQLRDSTRFIRRHLRELRGLRRHRLHAVLDFAVHDTRTPDRPLLSWRLPVALLELLAAGGIEAEVSVYPR